MSDANEIAERIRMSYDECKRGEQVWMQGRQAWIEGTLKLAQALAEGRSLCGDDDVAFGRWLVDNNADVVGRDDRAALINLGQNLTLTREILQRCASNSWRNIWEHNKTLYRSHAIEATESPKPEQTPVPAGKTDIPAVEQPQVSERQASEPAMPKALENKPTAPESKAALAKVPGGDSMLKIFRSKDTRSNLHKIAKRSSNGGWKFLIDCHAELNTSPTDAVIRTTSLRLIFPWLEGHGFATRFDICNRDDRRIIKEEVIPVVRANEAALQANPDLLAGLVDQARQERSKERAIQRQRPLIEKAYAAMPREEEEIIFYGKRLWPLAPFEKPIDDHNHYQTLCFAIWWFEDARQLNYHADERSPAHIAKGIRWMMRFQHEWGATYPEPTRGIIAKFCNLIIHLSQIYERAEGKGEYKRPVPPLRIEGASASL